MKEDEIKALKQRIKDLESELEVSLAREEIKDGGGPLKRALLRTSIGKIAADPTSTIGKALRFPRTCLRIVAYPHLIKEIHQKGKKKKSTSAPTEISYASFSPFGPFEIVNTKSDSPRVNLVISSLGTLADGDITTLKKALSLAKELSAKLRLILLADTVDPVAFNKFLLNNKVPKPDVDLEFYSLPDQAQKGDKKYALEVGDSETFISVTRREKHEA